MLREYFDKLYTGSQQEFFRQADRWLEDGTRAFIVTANPETMMTGESDPAMDRTLMSPDCIIVPDGIGVVKAAGRLGLEMHGRVTGVELAEHLIAKAGETGRSVYLFGASREVLDALVTRVRSEYPDIVIAGCRNGYGGAENDDGVFAEIQALEPDLVLVALGIPRQEILIGRWIKTFSKGIFVGVGGAFDVLSGTKKRAPAFFVKCNLEWLYRILREPRRFGRFFRNNVRFVSRVRKLGRARKSGAMIN